MNDITFHTNVSVEHKENGFIFNTFREDIINTQISSIYDDLNNGNEDRLYYSGDLNQLRKPWLTDNYFIPAVIIYVLAFLVGIIGNSFVIVAVVRDTKQRTNTTIFLLNLAISDIIFLVVCVPYEISWHFVSHWQLGIYLCKFSGFVEMMTAVQSVLHLTVVSVESSKIGTYTKRHQSHCNHLLDYSTIINMPKFKASVEEYIVIVHPMRSRYLCTFGNMRRVIPVVWCTAVILSSPTFFIMSTEFTVFYNNQSSINVIFCSDYGVTNECRSGFAVYQLIIMFILPTAVMTACYIRVVHALCISAQQLSHLTLSEKVCDTLVPDSIEIRSLRQSTATPRLLKQAIICHKSKVHASRKQVVKLLLVIIVAFFLCWCPKLVMRILQKLQLSFLYSQPAYFVKVFLDWMPFIQSCLNPLFYFMMSRKFRRSIKILLSCKIQRSVPSNIGLLDVQTVTLTCERRHLQD